VDKGKAPDQQRKNRNESTPGQHGPPSRAPERALRRRSGGTRTTSVQRCIGQIRSLIQEGEFLPGQPLRQNDLASRLKTSRIPVREALAILESEGALTYTPHVGHTVVRLDEEQLAEIYAMRRLIEMEIVRSIDLSSVNVQELAELNEKMALAMQTFELGAVTALNQDFHFYLFAYSPLTMMQTELRRMWNMSGFYRSLRLYDVKHRDRIIKEHELILDAVKARQTDQLIEALDVHRAWRGTEHAFLLRPARPLR
jgi:DNA-binding GntR family transcriptional regulator